MRKDEFNYKENVIPMELKDKAKEAISIYAPNKNVYRHIPFMNDGLLPSERRALYAMWKDVKAYPWTNYKKLGLVLGATMVYHPHGETNIYNTVVKLAQSWKNACEFVDGSGSYGNEMGDQASAFRYLEARLSQFAYKCYFEDFSEDLVDMRAGYIEGVFEPEYLPARYPVALTKSCKAIGYGMYSQYPNYNFKEIVEFTLKLMDDPNYDKVIYPDIPNKCEIIDDGQFDEIRRTGKGQFRMKSKVNIDYECNKIEILSVPQGTDLSSISNKIVEMGKSGELIGFIDIHNLNDKRNKNGKKRSKEKDAKLSIEVLFKPGTDLQKNLELMYKKTTMLMTASYDLTLVDDYKLRHYTVRTLLLDWISFRRDIKRRQINKQITKKMERKHILETLLFITNNKNGQTTIKLATQSENAVEFQGKLVSTFGISTLQAKAISKMSVTAFNKDSHRKYQEEFDKIEIEIKKLLIITKSSKLIDNIIKDELKEGIHLFSRPRSSEIVEFGENKFIPDTNHKIVITKDNMIKKLDNDTTGVGYLNDGDKGKDLFTINNRDSILVFDKRGNMSEINVNDISSTPVDSGGVDLENMITVAGDIVTSFPKPPEKIDDKETYLVLTTKKGLSKKLSYRNINKIRGTVIAIKLAEDDELVSVDVLYGQKDMIVYTREGGGVRISTDDIRECGRAAYGLSVIDLAGDDEVIGTTIINKNHKYMLVVTSKGKMKKCTLSTFKTMKRKSATLQISRLDKNEVIVSVKSVKPTNKVMVYTENMEQEIKVKDVPELTRQHPCKKIMTLKNKDKVIDVVVE
jgi:DNA gyrase/topoisomerase IV subunit A